MPAHLRFAAAAGVRLTTFDTVHELEKIAMLHPQTGLYNVCEHLLLIESAACRQEHRSG